MDTTKGEDSYYNNQWWIYNDGVYAAEGHLGQFVSVHPEQNMIFVRLGKKWGKDQIWTKLFKSLATKLNK